MNNATKNISETGQLARGLICNGLEVNAEIAAEEPNYSVKDLDAAVLKIVKKFGVVAVLDAIHDAACGAAEVHEDCDDPMDNPEYGVVAVRLKMFCRKVDAATKTLR